MLEYCQHNRTAKGMDERWGVGVPVNQDVGVFTTSIMVMGKARLPCRSFSPFRSRPSHPAALFPLHGERPLGLFSGEDGYSLGSPEVVVVWAHQVSPLFSFAISSSQITCPINNSNKQMGTCARKTRAPRVCPTCPATMIHSLLLSLTAESVEYDQPSVSAQPWRSSPLTLSGSSDVFSAAGVGPAP